MNKLFAKYFNSVCSPGEFDEFHHLVSDRKHDELLGRWLKPYWDEWMNSDENFSSDKVLWSRISQVIEREERKSIQRKLKIYSIAFKVAAVLVIGLLTSTILLYFQSDKMNQQAVLQTVSVPFGARTCLTLPDSSLVWVNSGSTVSYSNDFRQNRSIYLSGEAFFEVIKNEVPFMVETDLGSVTVKGTSFNVKAIIHDKQFETTVEEGSVIVAQPDNSRTALLKKGQQARVINNELKLSKVETELYTSWKDGRIIFRNEYLPEVAKRLERWYNVKIELDSDPRLAKIHYTGTLEMESFVEVMELLKVTASIDYTYNDKTRVIKITYKNQVRINA